jgi:histidinol-phosphate/aromatic aminotransferase/cobyric acid decarboxylase-like protein
VPRRELESWLRRVPPTTLVWIDETYVDYVGKDESLECFAATRENVVVCKSMSKVYALSGARAAYLCASPHLLERLRALTPPWAVGLPAQVAAVEALGDEPYYATRYEETRTLRRELALGLRAMAAEVVPGVANFVLAHLPTGGPSAAEIVERCAARDLFVRDASTMGSHLGPHALRIAVKDRKTSCRMLGILRAVTAAEDGQRTVSVAAGSS